MERPRRNATCHPERKHFALGLCRVCYSAVYYSSRHPATKRSQRNAVCHPERKHKAFGLCLPCYDSSGRRVAARVTRRSKKAEYDATYHATHQKKRATYRAEYRKTHRLLRRVLESARRTRRAGNGGRHTVTEWLAMCRSESWQCTYCAAVLDVKTVSQDHRIPLSRGGSNDITNLAVACRSCNSSKHARTDVEFMTIRRQHALSLKKAS